MASKSLSCSRPSSSIILPVLRRSTPQPQGNSCQLEGERASSGGRGQRVEHGAPGGDDFLADPVGGDGGDTEGLLGGHGILRGDEVAWVVRVNSATRRPRPRPLLTIPSIGLPYRLSTALARRLATALLDVRRRRLHERRAAGVRVVVRVTKAVRSSDAGSMRRTTAPARRPAVSMRRAAPRLRCRRAPAAGSTCGVRPRPRSRLPLRGRACRRRAAHQAALLGDDELQPGEIAARADPDRRLTAAIAPFVAVVCAGVRRARTAGPRPAGRGARRCPAGRTRAARSPPGRVLTDCDDLFRGEGGVHGDRHRRVRVGEVSG